MPRSVRKLWKEKVVGLALLMIMFATILPYQSVQAVDLGESYLVMQRDYPEMIERLKAGGASDANIEAFLVDMENDVSQRGTLTEANFNSYMYQSLQEVLTQRQHRTLFLALVDQFGEEIDYTMKNGQLHPDLVPIRNAVMEAVLQTEDPVEPHDDPNDNDTSGGGHNTSTNPVTSLESVNQEIQRQLNTDGEVVELEVGSNNLITIKGSSLNNIWTSSRDLIIEFTGVSLQLPQNSLVLSDNNTLSISVTPVSQSKQEEILKKTSSYYKILGQIFEISATTQSSLGSVIFRQPVTVTYAYSGISLDGIDEASLDMYYFNESSDKWEKMGGTIDRNTKTISFTTTHFSKYALISYTPSSGTFADLVGHWAENDINNMVSKGLVKGISPTHFGPDANITRAEFAALLIRALGIPEGSHIMSQFSDVSAGDWYFNTVNTAAQSGLITGYTNSTFGPEDLVTREQMAVMLKRAMTYKQITVISDTNQIESLLDQFQDNPQISAWARDSVATAVDKGIIKGRSSTQFAPTATATRAEAAVMILRAYNQF